MDNKNGSYMYVGNVARGVNTISGMANGSIAVVNEANTVQTANLMSTSGNYRIAKKGSDGVVVYSDFFNPTKLKNVVGKSYSAPVMKVAYLGYNGTAEALDAKANEDYVVHVEWTNTAGFYNNRPLLTPFSYHTTTTSQYELAFGLLNSCKAALTRNVLNNISLNIVNSAAVTSSNDFLGASTVVKGSNAFTIAESSSAAKDAGTYATNSILAAGDYVRIGSVDGGTALTSGVYKVLSVTGASTASATVVVDRNIVEASGTYAAGTHDIEVIPAGSIGANCGIKFTGVDNPNFNPITDTYNLPDFKLILNSAFVTGTVTYSTMPSYGINNTKLLAAREAFAQFASKDPVVSAYPPTKYRQDVDLAGTYDSISFDIEEPVVTWTGTGLTSSKQIHITILTKVALGADDLDTVFNVGPL